MAIQKMKVELRGQGRVHISGYVNAVDRFSRPIRDSDGKSFIEKIQPGTFQRAIDAANDIEVKLDHRRTITTVKRSGITLREDNVGLYFDGDICDSEVEEKARAGKLRGWSFGFRLLRKTDKECDRSDADFERTVEEMSISEVSIIDDMAVPCYNGTSIMTRAQDDGENAEETVFRGGEAETDFQNKSEKNQLDIRRRRLAAKKKI